MDLRFYILLYMSIFDAYTDFTRKKYIKSEQSAMCMNRVPLLPSFPTLKDSHGGRGQRLNTGYKLGFLCLQKNYAATFRQASTSVNIPA